MEATPRPALIAVIRTAVTMTALEAALSALYLNISWGCLVVAMVAALIAWLIARRISQPLEEMKQAAAHFAHGDFSEKMPERGALELVSLSQTLNEMAAQLEERF